MEVLLTLASITKMPLYKAASPVSVTEALIARKLAEQGKRVGSEKKEDAFKDGKFAGAYVKEPKVGFYQGVSAFDFASLYPSIMRQFNISPDSYKDIIPKSQIAERRLNKDEIVCANGVVYDKKDSILKQLRGDLYNQRRDYKNISYYYYSKAEEIKNRLKKL
jgi:DNA polymerase elongation subunit (family B)